jgi:hypothetical protein
MFGRQWTCDFLGVHKKKVEKMLGWKESPIGQVEIKPTGREQDKYTKGKPTAWVLVPQPGSQYY